jgi:DNA-directed RNA polymerase subunit RPC12/RpoP
MKITFSCGNCRSQFTVDGQLAGRSARCKKCGEKFVIPATSTVAPPPRSAPSDRARSSIPPTGRTLDPRRGSMATSRPKSATGSAPAQAEGVASRSIGWLDAVNSQIALKPVTMMSMPAARKRAREEEEEDEGPAEYKVVIPRDMRKRSAIVTKPAEIAAASYLEGIRSYRQFFNMLAILFRWINETAYGVSLIFLNVAIVGAIMSRHSLVVLGISLVVMLNVIQLIAGAANLIAIHFRGNIVRGLLFLIPPITVYYLWTGRFRWNKAIHRVTGPMVWLVVVIAAYSYIPWLNGSKSGKESWKGAVETIRKDVKETMSGLKEKAADLKEKVPGELEKLNLDDLKKSADEAVDDLKTRAEKAIDESRAPAKRDSGGKAEPPKGKSP